MGAVRVNVRLRTAAGVVLEERAVELKDGERVRVRFDPKAPDQAGYLPLVAELVVRDPPLERLVHGIAATLAFVVLVLFAVDRSKRLSDFLEALADERVGYSDKLRALVRIVSPRRRA